MIDHHSVCALLGALCLAASPAAALAQSAPASAQAEAPTEAPASAPAAASAAPAPETKSETAACPVQVYRMKTSFNRVNPELPYVFADDQKIGRLGVGKTLCLKLAPGKHVVAIKEAFMFMPGPTSGTVEVEVLEGKSIYVRYAKEFGGMAATPTGAMVTARDSLRLATEDEWKGRL